MWKNHMTSKNSSFSTQILYLDCWPKIMVKYAPFWTPSPQGSEWTRKEESLHNLTMGGPSCGCLTIVYVGKGLTKKIIQFNEPTETVE